MNLYEYSQINNREMGVLLIKEDEGNDLFEDAIKEINQIINGSNIEKSSRETIEEGFEIDIIKTTVEKLEVTCKKINKIFVHKKFAPKAIHTNYRIVCQNYFDKIDVVLDGRAEFTLNFSPDRVLEIYQMAIKDINEFRFSGYKFYWNHHTSNIYLYKNSKHPLVAKITSDEDEYLFMKNGIDRVIEFLRAYL